MTNTPNNGRHRLLVILGLLMLAVAAPPLVGCVQGGDPAGQTVGITSEYQARENSREQLIRFRAVYDEYAAKDKSSNARLQHFNDAFRRVRDNYVKPIDNAVLIGAAIEGVRALEGEPGTFAPADVAEAGLDAMLESLDPHSSYMNADELRESSITTRGEFGGLGIEVIMEDGLVKVVSPIEDTPADRAGLQSGDKISHIDGAPVKGKTLGEAIKIMRGKPGTDIRLGILREGAKPFDVTITRAIISVRAVRWRVEGDIGYVRVGSFSEKVEDGIERAMSAINDELDADLRGIVLDLRNNPGGLLTQSVELSDAFLDDGVVVSVRGREDNDEFVYHARDGDYAHGVPMVVLINGGSASASEIVAGALQDHKRAVVMGSRSFGKGSVQTIMPLPLDGALRLTTQLYYLPSDTSIQGQGITPDIEILPAKKPDDEQAAGETAPKKEGEGEAAAPVAFPRREADQPGAIKLKDHVNQRTARASVAEDLCPVVTVRERDDRVLGCALEFLKAGTTAQFLAAIDAGGAL